MTTIILHPDTIEKEFKIDALFQNVALKFNIEKFIKDHFKVDCLLSEYYSAQYLSKKIIINDQKSKNILIYFCSVDNYIKDNRKNISGYQYTLYVIYNGYYVDKKSPFNFAYVKGPSDTNRIILNTPINDLIQPLFSKDILTGYDEDTKKNFNIYEILAYALIKNGFSL